MIGRREISAAAMAGMAVLLMVPHSVLAERAMAGGQDQIRLPKPKTTGGMSLAEALAKRRTHRKFADTSLSLEQISQLCWAAQGITEPTRGLRTAPSAGALFPITVFIINRSGLYEYRPQQHVLRRLAAGDVRDIPRPGALGKSNVRSAPVCMVVTMDVSRTATKYRKDAERYCLLEVGHVAQSVLLQATAMDLVGVPVGGLDEKKVAATLNLPDRLRPVYLLPLGYPLKE